MSTANLPNRHPRQDLTEQPSLTNNSSQMELSHTEVAGAHPQAWQNLVEPNWTCSPR